MPRFHLVTDSGTQLESLAASEPLSATLIPTRPSSRPDHLPAPDVEDYVRTFTTLGRTYDGLVCLVPSRHLSPHWQIARQAVQQIAGGCPIRIVDSQSISGAQTLIALEVGRRLNRMNSLDDIERRVRGAVARTYFMIYVEQVEQLVGSSLLNPSHGVMSAMLGVKPLFAMEGGLLKPTEKVKTRAIAIERLIEFAAEFTHSAHLVIMVDTTGHNIAEELKKELQDENSREIDTIVYNQPLTALVGSGAVGIAILENPKEQD
jgi:DegV family protein with EDD domain